MHVKVKLFATLVGHVPGVKSGIPFDVEIPEGTTLADLMKRLKLPQNQVKVAFVNGRTQPLDFQLQRGNEVGIFPPIGGG